MPFSWRLYSSTQLDFFNTSDIDSWSLLVNGWMLNSDLWWLKRDRGLSAFFSSELYVYISAHWRLWSHCIILTLYFIRLDRHLTCWNFRLRIKGHFSVVSSLNNCSVSRVAIDRHHKLWVSNFSILVHIQGIIDTLIKILSPVEFDLFVFFLLVLVESVYA